MLISTIEHKSLFSPYLMGGFRQDSHDLYDIDYSPERISAKVSVKDYFMPSDGQYHFTAFHSQIFVSQLMLTHMCLHEGMSRKPGEAYMRSFSMKMLSPINKLKDIQVDLNMKKIRHTESSGIFLFYEFSIDRGAFRGECSGVQRG